MFLFHLSIPSYTFPHKKRFFFGPAENRGLSPWFVWFRDRCLCTLAVVGLVQATTLLTLPAPAPHVTCARYSPRDLSLPRAVTGLLRYRGRDGLLCYCARRRKRRPAISLPNRKCPGVAARTDYSVDEWKLSRTLSNGWLGSVCLCTRGRRDWSMLIRF